MKNAKNKTGVLKQINEDAKETKHGRNKEPSAESLMRELDIGDDIHHRNEPKSQESVKSEKKSVTDLPKMNTRSLKIMENIAIHLLVNNKSV